MPFSLPDDLLFTPVPLESLWSFFNRSCRVKLPPERNQYLGMRLLERALSASGKKGSLQACLGALPQCQFEQLLQAVLNQSFLSLGVQLSPTLDSLFSLYKALGEGLLYQSDALLSQDFAVLAHRHQGGLHGRFFELSTDRERVSALLRFEGYDDAFMKLPISIGLAYWLCRSQQAILPWTAAMASFDDHAATRFPELAGMKSIYDMERPRFEAWATASLYSAGGEAFSREKALTLLSQMQQVLCSASKPASTTVASMPRLLILVEGATEEIVLPAIAEAMGQSFPVLGVMVAAVDGKSQMMGRFMEAIDSLTIPVVALLDADAADLAVDLAYYQRSIDDVLVLEAGEIEDTYSPTLIMKTLNTIYPSHLEQFPSPEAVQAYLSSGHVAGLEKLWHAAGLGRFDKVAFASALKQVLISEKSVSPAMQELMTTLLAVRERSVLSPILQQADLDAQEALE